MLATTSEEKPCTICGGTGAAFHYEGFACQSCRVFFVRTIRRKSEAKCRNGDDSCTIVPLGRSNCTACRFAKCLTMGMQPERVGKFTAKLTRRKRMEDKNIKKKAFQKEIQACFGPQGLAIVDSVQALDILSFVKQMIHFERTITNLEGSMPTGSQVNPNCSIAELLMNPGYYAPRESAAWCTRLCKKETGTYSIIHIFTRFAVYLADFMGSIQEFHSLSGLDKIKMAQFHLGHLGALDSAFYLWKFGIENPNSVSKTQEYTMSDYEKSCWNERCRSAARFQNSVMEVFKEINVTHEEVLVFKLVVLFHSPENLSEEGRRICRVARGKYQTMLANYISLQFPKLSNKDKMMRIQRIFDCFAFVRALSQDSGQKYVIMIYNDIGGMKRQLPYDVRVKVYE